LLALTPLLAPRAARADDPALGLDLSDSAKPADASKPVAPPPDLGPDPKPKDGALDVGERDVSLGDRVKSVQKKRYNKKYHFELTPHAGLSPNDAFFQKFNLGGQVAFHPSDALAIAGRFDYYLVQTSDNVRTAKRTLQSRLPVSKPKYGGGLDLLWTPIYGKASLFNSIVQFDLFLLGGVGAVFSETSSNPDFSNIPTLNQGPHPALDLGVGQRYHLNDLLALEWQVVESLYPDTPGGSGPSQLQHLMSVSVGLAFFLPPLRSE
jgi:outer membrane beta-barrel protein